MGLTDEEKQIIDDYELARRNYEQEAMSCSLLRHSHSSLSEVRLFQMRQAAEPYNRLLSAKGDLVYDYLVNKLVVEYEAKREVIPAGRDYIEQAMDNDWNHDDTIWDDLTRPSTTFVVTLIAVFIVGLVFWSVFTWLI